MSISIDFSSLYAAIMCILFGHRWSSWNDYSVATHHYSQRSCTRCGEYQKYHHNSGTLKTFSSYDESYDPEADPTITDVCEYPEALSKNSFGLWQLAGIPISFLLGVGILGLLWSLLFDRKSE